jgi:hypothetical protein
LGLKAILEDGNSREIREEVREREAVQVGATDSCTKGARSESRYLTRIKGWVLEMTSPISSP